MVEVVETLEAKLKRHEDALIACMAEITKLREENARLRSSENNAHSVLREVYNDPTASPAVRVKAAGLALSHESAPLKAVSPPLELTANDDPDSRLPLAELVAKRRARCYALQQLPVSQGGVAPNSDGVARRDGNGNGSDDDTAAG
jgi:hypothetical protein